MYNQHHFTSFLVSIYHFTYQTATGTLEFVLYRLLMVP